MTSADLNATKQAKVEAASILRDCAKPKDVPHDALKRKETKGGASVLARGGDLNAAIQIDSDFQILEQSHKVRTNHLLREVAPKIYNAIIRDEVAATLQQNSVSAEFFKDRVCEIITASLEAEKEHLV